MTKPDPAISTKFGGIPSLAITQSNCIVEMPQSGDHGATTLGALKDIASDIVGCDSTFSSAGDKHV